MRSLPSYTETGADGGTGSQKRSNEANGEHEENAMGLRRGGYFPMISRGPLIAMSGHMLSDPHGTNPLTKTIIGCAIRVHRVIGPGVFENVYAECLAYELHEHGLGFETERLVSLVY